MREIFTTGDCVEFLIQVIAQASGHKNLGAQYLHAISFISQSKDGTTTKVGVEILSDQIDQMVKFIDNEQERLTPC